MKPKTKSSQVVYTGFFNVKEDILERHDGQTGCYTCLSMDVGASIVLAQDSQGRWVLNREYRHPTKELILGCAGGRLEPGEDPVEGAKRELFEETGYWSDEIHFLGECYQCPAISNQKIYYYFATNAKKKGEQNLDLLEYIEPCVMSDEELRQAIQAGNPIDGSLFTALWLWKTRY